jgi:hypothetical protein
LRRRRWVFGGQAVGDAMLVFFLPGVPGGLLETLKCELLQISI